jgi:exopolysaccharide biosynthesis polyprenyl glycosylphosphotransferase
VQAREQVTDPAVIPSKKLLRNAAVGRTIPGLGTTTGPFPRKKPPHSTRLALRFGLHECELLHPEAEPAVQLHHEFSLPERALHIHRRLVQDACANLFLALISLAIVHIPMMAHTWNVHLFWDAQVVICCHLLVNDLGLALMWAVLVTLFRHLFTEAQELPNGRVKDGTLDFKAITLTAFIIIVALHLSHVDIVSSRSLIGLAVLNFVGSLGRQAWKQRRDRIRCRSEKNAKNVLIAGAGELAQDVAEYLSRHKENLRIVKGFLDQNRKSPLKVLGRIEDLAEVARTHFIDEVIVALPQHPELARTAILEALRNHLDVRIVAAHFEPYSPAQHRPIPILPVHEEPIPEMGLILKRTIDVVFASIGLLVLLPALIMISAIICVDSKGWPFYRGLRVGRKGREFLCYKFRTMSTDADRSKETLRRQNERVGPTFKMANDPRITRVGRFLRRYSLDELPQLWNVLVGDMSLVGPRPHPLDDYRRYGLQHLRRLDVTPGITGLWQVTARQDPSFAKNMELDLEYIDQWSWWMDLRILLRTVRVVLAGTGA